LSRGTSCANILLLRPAIESLPDGPSIEVLCIVHNADVVIFDFLLMSKSKKIAGEDADGR
jgi:hypothetical protein